MEFEEIYEEFQLKIRRYLARLIGKQDAQDAIQVVFAKVNRGLDSTKGQSKLTTWVYRIATNSHRTIAVSRP